LNRITFGGSLYLSAICVLPVTLQALVSNQVPFYFGGTGILIVVSVALDTVQQIEGHFIAKEYDSFAGRSEVKIRARGGSGPGGDNASSPHPGQANLG
jgi:preprotein translocase subunit SecY